jgi:hypothetical protein
MTEHQIKVEDITLLQLLRSLSAKAAWGIATSCVVLIVGATTFGTWVQSIKDSSTFGELQHKVDEANGKVDEVNRKIDTVVGMLNEAGKRERAAAGKSEFIERYLAYVKAPSAPGAQSTFTDFVCALWRDSQERRVHIDERQLQLSPDQIRAGLSPELKRYLQSKGTPDILFQNAQKDFQPQTFPNIVPTVSPSPQEAVATIQKVVASETLEKIVKFYDGTVYKVPDEIAIAVHTDPQCRPK